MAENTSLISFNELAAQCNGVLGVATLRRYIAEGRIPYIQLGGKGAKLLFAADVLEQLMRQAVQESQSDSSERVTRSRWARRHPKPD